MSESIIEKHTKMIKFYLSLQNLVANFKQMNKKKNIQARFSIANRLTLGFGILIVAFFVYGLYIYSIINENQSINSNILNNYDPSVNKLNDLASMINNSQMLIKNWVYIEKQTNTPDKKKLNDLHQFHFVELKKELKTLSAKWDTTSQKKLNNILVSITDTLFKDQQVIMQSLKTFEDYNNIMTVFEITPMIEEGGSIIENTKRILLNLNELQKHMEEQSVEAKINMADSFSNVQRIIIIAVLILSLFVVIVGVITTRSLIKPIQKLKGFLITMTKGNLPKEKLVTNNDEIGDMGDALNEYIANIQKTSEFAASIGLGKYDAEYKAISEDDILGNALLEMRKNLKLAQEENKKREENDKIQNWTTKGLADFGNILRQNSSDMGELSKEVLSNIIDYLQLNQGAIYIINDGSQNEKKFLEMKAVIAYEREKAIHKQIEIDEGLVGRCFFEKLPIYLKEIPENYINITSGLGTAEPRNLLLIPLIINENVMGILELASFNEIHQYQIDFLVQLGENIASTIMNVRTNEKTKKLLEESKVRSNELAEQEEELRQNMEELQATQEEAARREKEMSNNIASINNVFGSIDIDEQGIITSVNNYLVDKMKTPTSALIGKNFQETFAANNKTEFLTLWDKVKNGEKDSIMTNFANERCEYLFKHTVIPFKSEDGKFLKAIDLVVDIAGKNF